MTRNLLKENSTKFHKKNYAKGTVLLFLIVLFMALFLIGGMKIYPDTASYLGLSPNRDPGYSLLLSVFHALFGETGFWILAFLQNALAVCSVYLTACYIGSKLKENIFLFLITILLVLPYVVTPLFASSGIILTNAMLSEGITYPVYGLFVLFLLKAVWEKEETFKYLEISLAFGFLLCIIRGQMLITLFVWLMVALALWLKKKDYKKVIYTVVLFILCLGIRSVGISTYNLVANGVYTGTTYGPVTILSNVIYVSDRADGDHLSDELKPLFNQMMDVTETEHMLYADAPADFGGEAAFYSKMHDLIKDEAIYPVLQDYVAGQGIEFTPSLVEVDRLAAKMMKELLPSCFGRWFGHYMRNIAVGLIRTVTFLHPLLNIPSLLGYVVLILLGISCYKKNRTSQGASILMITALLTAANVAAVSLTIMCISRYMIYNMAYIYISALLLLTEIFEKKKRRPQWDLKN